MTDPRQSTSMRAFVKVGDDNDDIEFGTAAVPRVGEREMLVRIQAVGVGIHDSYFLPRQMAYPYPIGIEAAGVIVDVGEQVTDLVAGDHVSFVSMMQPKGGTWAEYAVVSRDALLLRVPDGMSWTAAAAIPVAGNTVLRALHALSLGPDDTLFIAGASGAIGTFAIQIATARGIRVAGSSSPRNHDHLAAMGAELAVDYRDAEWPALVRGWRPGGVDAAMAVQPGTGGDSLGVVRDGGRLVTISGDRVTSARGVTVAQVPHDVDLRDQLDQLMHDANEGKVRVVLDRVLPFDRGLDALRQTQTRRARGKLVLDLSR